MKHTLTPIAAALVALLSPLVQAGTATEKAVDDDTRTKTLGTVVVTGSQPTSLPTTIPTTIEGIRREQIEQTINATDSEDALKYFPSLLVRKRYIGDYNHAILSTRASGTGNSARSAVYADGILLSNFLGNGVGGLSFPPRWGLVTPEEIERVDVMYGPFSAAYPGNSVGAVVDYVTRMPRRFEAHAKVGYSVQPFDLYSTHATYRAWQASASLGDRQGDWSWWLNVNHTDSHGQPLTFATRTVSSGTPSAAPGVSGAVPEKNTGNADIYVLGTGTEYHTKQDHLKVKLAYDITSTVRAAYTFGWWQNRSEGRPTSYLRDANGNAVYSGPLVINGRSFTPLSAGDFPLTRETLTHSMHGLSVKSNTRGTWDWSIAASAYLYDNDEKRQNSSSLPGAAAGGTGTLADGSGTGWTTLAARGTWRPQGLDGAHIVDFGAQQDVYQLKYPTFDIRGNWQADGGGAPLSNVGGDTRLHSLYAQDAWHFAPDWKTVLGGRLERWSTSGWTQIYSSPTASPPSAVLQDEAWPSRHETYFSPKAALSWQVTPTGLLKAAVGRAVRMPTVGELYGASATSNSRYINDPTLRPERSLTGELSWEQTLRQGTWRITYFAENTRDALYSQSTVEVINSVNTNVSRVQNVGRIATQGLETAFSTADLLLRGLDLQGSLTYANSVIKENAGFINVAGDTLGKQQPNIPHWRAALLASYRWSEQWSTSLGARYSSRQYRTLNNADINGNTYQGVSKYFTTDLRVHWRIDRQWSAALGIDNLNNDRYWNFHPYPQRSYSAEVRFDL